MHSIRLPTLRTIPIALMLAPFCSAEPPGLPVWSTFRYSDSVSIRYYTAGHGRQTVLLLHGLAASSATWLEMLPYLSCDCTIYALDLKGHGGSSKPDDHAYNLVDNSAIVRTFIRERALHDVIVIGHSYGGAVALRTTIDEPALIKALVLIGTPGTKQHFPLTMTALRFQRPARFFERFTPPEFAAWVALRHVYYNHDAITPAHIELYANLWRDPAANRAMRETGARFLNGGLDELAANVHKIAVPTLVIAGAHDRIVKPKHQQRLADRIRGAKYVVFDGCGHVPQEEYPSDTARMIASFVGNLRNEPNSSIDTM